jgi:hypothetical protein
VSRADLDLVARIGGATNFLAVVSVARPDGSVHSSLANVGLLEHPGSGERVVALVVRSDARKLALIEAAGRATVTYRDGWEWVSVEGTAEVAGTEPGLLRDVFRGAGGTHDDWDEYDRVMAAEHRTAILITPSRIITN